MMILAVKIPLRYLVFIYVVLFLLVEKGKLTAFFVIYKFISMTKRYEFTSSMNNSSATSTSTHETGVSVIALTGNPYTDLAAYGIDLHGCTIRYLRKPNLKGNIITGVFNISGREETAGATCYESLIHFLVDKRREYRRYVSECHQLKRQRYYESWLSRHPELTFNNCNVTFM